jgi:hypothetical protein
MIVCLFIIDVSSFRPNAVQERQSIGYHRAVAEENSLCPARDKVALTALNKLLL